MNKNSSRQLLNGHVLHRRDYGNTSLLLELFTRSQGRFPAIAKGAKRPRTLAAAVLQPFRPLLLSVSGRGEVRTLTHVEQAEAAVPLAGVALYCGFYLNELVMRLLGRNDPYEQLYDTYRTTLVELARVDDMADVLRRFELQLLEQAGYALVLDRDVDQDRPLDPQARYQYDPQCGPRACSAVAPGFSVTGSTLLALAAGHPLQGVAAKEARELMRGVLAYYLEERPLKSRELFHRAFPKTP